MLLQILVAICIVILGLFVKQYLRRRKHPPGPLGIPFFGETPFRIIQFFFPKLFSSKSQIQYFMDMKKKYGNIWSVDEGDKITVILASIDAVTEAFIDNGKVFSGRPLLESLKVFGECRGIITSEGEMWQANRQLALKALKDLGMGKQILESQISEEADELIEIIEKNSDKPITSPTIFIKAASNIIAKMDFNVRNKYDDQDFERFIRNLQTLGHSIEASSLVDLFSKIMPMTLMRKIFSSVDGLICAKDQCIEFIENKCRDRAKVESEYSKPACVFDFFWRYRYQDHPEMKFDEKLHEIAFSMFDLYFGGTDTINNILGFCLLFLGKDHNLQIDLRQEIQSLVDDYKLINMEMRKNCPKLQSFIDEVYRFCPLDTLFFRRALSDIVFRGYEIQSNDVVYGDIIAITRDPLHFENPDVFNAYRFLDKSRTKYIPSKSVVPFGMGKRSCLGESMAVMELFLFISKIILKFDLTLPIDTNDNFDEIVEGTSGFVHAPLDHKIKFQPIDSK